MEGGAAGGDETIRFSEEHEVPYWAVKAAGPWAKKRSFLDDTLCRERFPFVDLFAEGREGPKMDWLVEGLLPKRYLAVLGGPRPGQWAFMCSFERLYIDDPVGLQTIGESAGGNHVGLIVVDPLHAAYSAGTIAEGSTARRVMSGLKEFTRDLDVTVLIIHHLTKQVGSGLIRERMADSGQILAAASMDWLMEVVSQGEVAGRRSQVGVSRRGRGGDAEAQRGEDGGFTIDDLRLTNGQGDGNGECGRVDGWKGGRGEGSEGGEDGEGGEDRMDGKDRGCGRVIRLLGRGRGEAVNRNWLIESPAPMVYRLIGEGRKTFRSLLEGRILDALAGGLLGSQEIAARVGSPVGTVRNALTRMVASGEVQVAGKEGRKVVYGVRGSESEV